MGSVGGGFEELDCVPDRENFLSGIIRNFASELFFERHHEFDGIEAVSAEVVDEARAFGNFALVDTQMFDNNFLNAVSDIAHVCMPLLLWFLGANNDTLDTGLI
mgnify:FL=1